MTMSLSSRIIVILFGVIAAVFAIYTGDKAFHWFFEIKIGVAFPFTLFPYLILFVAGVVGLILGIDSITSSQNKGSWSDSTWEALGTLVLAALVYGTLGVPFTAGTWVTPLTFVMILGMIPTALVVNEITLEIIKIRRSNNVVPFGDNRRNEKK